MTATTYHAFTLKTWAEHPFITLCHVPFRGLKKLDQVLVFYKANSLCGSYPREPHPSPAFWKHYSSSREGPPGLPCHAGHNNPSALWKCWVPVKQFLGANATVHLQLKNKTLSIESDSNIRQQVIGMTQKKYDHSSKQTNIYLVLPDQIIMIPHGRKLSLAWLIPRWQANSQ